MDYTFGRLIGLGYFHYRVGIANVHLMERKTGWRVKPGKPRPLESDRIVVVQIVNADDRIATSEKCCGDVRTNESRRPGYQNEHACLRPQNAQETTLCSFSESSIVPLKK